MLFHLLCLHKFNTNADDKVYGAVIIMRSLCKSSPVYLMDANWVTDGCQPLHQASWLIDLGFEFASRLPPSTSPSPFITISQPEVYTLFTIPRSGWMFLLVPAYPGCPGSKAVKRSLYHPTKGGKLSWPRHCCKGALPMPKAVYCSGCHDKHNCPWRDSHLGFFTPLCHLTTVNCSHCELQSTAVRCIFLFSFLDVSVFLSVVLMTSCCSTDSKKPHHCCHLTNNFDSCWMFLIQYSQWVERCPANCPFCWGGFGPYLIHDSLGPPESMPQRALGSVEPFCRAHGCDPHRETQTMLHL